MVYGDMVSGDMVSGDMVYGDMVFNKSKTTWIAMLLVHLAMPADCYFCQKRLFIYPLEI